MIIEYVCIFGILVYFRLKQRDEMDCPNCPQNLHILFDQFHRRWGYFLTRYIFFLKIEYYVLAYQGLVAKYGKNDVYMYYVRTLIIIVLNISTTKIITKFLLFQLLLIIHNFFNQPRYFFEHRMESYLLVFFQSRGSREKLGRLFKFFFFLI